MRDIGSRSVYRVTHKIVQKHSVLRVFLSCISTTVTSLEAMKTECHSNRVVRECWGSRMSCQDIRKTAVSVEVRQTVQHVNPNSRLRFVLRRTHKILQIPLSTHSHLKLEARPSASSPGLLASLELTPRFARYSAFSLAHEQFLF